MNYEITIKDYLCLLKGFDESKGFVANDCNEICYSSDYITYSHDNGDRWMNYTLNSIEGNVVKLVVQPFDQRNVKGEKSIITYDYDFFEQTELSSLMKELKKIPEGDFEGLGDWCGKFLKYDNLNLGIYLWRQKFKIGRDIKVRSFGEKSWCYSPWAYPMYEGDGKNIYISYKIDGKVEKSEYKKYKELEAYL